MVINGYELVGELKTDNSGFSKWGIAKRERKQFFIKEFLSPVYPIYMELLEPGLLESRKKICDEYEQKMRLLYQNIEECSDGNLVCIEEFFRYGSKYYITTELLPPVEKNSVVLLPMEQRERLCRILLHSILCLHKRGIVHGDIKMNNIIFKWLPSGYLTVKVIDFDNCFWEAKPPLPTEEIHGDMIYMAPETFRMMLEEEGRLTTAIDVFSLGIVFHEILTGEIPKFNREKYDYPFEAILDGDILYCSNELSTEIKVLMVNMLEKDPDKRITLEAAEYMLSKSKTKEVNRILAEERTLETDRVSEDRPPEASKNMEVFFQPAGDL